MPSKGIDVYSYVGVPNCTVEFSIPGRTLKNGPEQNFKHTHLEIDKKDLSGTFNFDGNFEFKVIKDGKELTKQWNKVNVLSGDLSDGSMLKISATQSIVKGDTVITYGFYDAGPKNPVGLTSSHQCYVTVSKRHTDWQGEIAPKGSEKAKKPLGTFALAAPHDPGMNTIDEVGALLTGNSASAAMSAWAGNIPLIKDLGSFGTSMVSNIIYGLAITQKDTIDNMLLMGCRYFEYRPAYMEDKIRKYCRKPDALWFQHACIPGTLFEEFLVSIVNFLDEHPTEIVVSRICWDGVTPGCKRPTKEDIQRIFKEQADKSKSKLKVGDKNSLAKPIDDLRKDNTRLILLTSDVSKYDSYDDTANATFDGKSIVERYSKMTTAEQKKKWYTVLQCQSTATNIKDVLKYSIATSNASTSCLMETKGRCDTRTLPWIRDNAIKNFDKSLLLVVMNDFIDGATVDASIELSKKRFA